MTEKTTSKTTKAAPKPSTPADKVKEAGYTVVGLGVMGAQKVAEKSKALLDRSPVDVNQAVDQAKDQMKKVQNVAARSAVKVDDAAGKAVAKIEAATKPLEEKLPSSARTVVDKTRSTSKDLHDQFRTKVLEPAAQG